MATPPTLAADFATPFDNSAPNTVAVTAAVGTTLVAIGANSELGSGVNDVTTPTGGPTWTLRQEHNGVPGSACDIALWTGTSAGNFTHSQSQEGGTGAAVGGLVYVYSGSDGYDNSAYSYSTTEPPTQAVTTTTDNCAIVWAGADYQAGADAARAYVTINGGAAVEDVYYRDASFMTFYSAHWADAGAAGSKTAGLASSDPGTMETSQVVVAIKGTAGSPPVALPYWGARMN